MAVAVSARQGHAFATIKPFTLKEGTGDPPMVLTTFLRGVVDAGRLVLREPLPAQADPGAAPLLREAFERVALTVAGPPIAFDAAVALAAARVLYHAAWCFLVPNDAVDSAALTMTGDPARPSHHLSADVALRYLPALYRRTRALRPGDELIGHLAELLRRWPLSGVLGDVAGPPLAPLDFGGHRGLQLLYAERLARHEKAAWFPRGPTRETIELVWQDLGRDLATIPIPADRPDGDA